MRSSRCTIRCHPEEWGGRKKRHSEEGSFGARRESYFRRPIQMKRSTACDNGNETLTSFRCAPLLRVTQLIENYDFGNRLCAERDRNRASAPSHPSPREGQGWGRQLPARWDTANTAVGNQVTVPRTSCIVLRASHSRRRLPLRINFRFSIPGRNPGTVFASGGNKLSKL